MMNVKISQKHKIRNVYHIIKHYALKSIYDDVNKCINGTFSNLH